ncbi:MAG TPA: ATP-binding protein [Kofleriaceae bacterium]|jgi:ATP-dependent 26S proteasome regulatory subunit|nr:ATP-binding protein [Kofleriaceae bacterium]
MDEATLRSLLEALAATPDNAALRIAVIRGLSSMGDARAAEHVGPLAPGALAAADRAFVSGVLLRAGAAARALAFADGPEPEVQLARARALHAQGDQPGALAAYEAAVRANSTLEDRDLRALLAASIRVHGDGDGPRLRLVSNDDTDRSEVDRLLHPEAPPVAFADVGGLDEIKAQIEKRIILPFQKPALFARFKRKPGGGILLYGPPGCGKTLLARATAGQCKARFLHVAIEDVLDMWIGESERKLHALFEQARAATPAVMFFDELEALAGKREYTREATSSKLVSQFLSEMDGFVKNNAGVLILAATNVPWAIDPAFRRPGRFDRVLFVPPPDRAARAAILGLVLAGRPTARDVDPAALAARTSGFSGADLENLVDTAADRAIAASLDTGGEVPIDQRHLVAALDEIKPTTLEWLTTARNYARYANEGGQYDEVLAFLQRHGKS